VLAAPCTMHDGGEKQTWPKTRRRAARGTHECRQTLVRGKTCPAGILPTVPARPGAAALLILAIHGVATSCVDRRRTTLQAPCRLSDVYSNLEPIGPRSSTRTLCPSHGVPGRLPCPSRGTTFEGGLTEGMGSCDIKFVFKRTQVPCIKIIGTIKKKG